MCSDLPFETPAVDIHEMSPLALAFVGDAVLELLVRSRLVSTTRLPPGKLHAAAPRYVSARAQFGELECLLGWLYLQGRIDRVQELFETLWQAGGEQEAQK